VEALPLTYAEGLVLFLFQPLIELFLFVTPDPLTQGVDALGSMKAINRA
jgi:hypothetical protein